VAAVSASQAEEATNDAPPLYANICEEGALAYQATITLTPVRQDPYGLDHVTFTACCAGHADKTWSLSPYQVASLLAVRFPMAEVAAIEGKLHKLASVALPGEYGSLQLIEMGYRVTKSF
jgi:hypothetical protein